MLPAITALLVLASPPATEPWIELMTMGPGDDLFHRYGHAGLCVVHARAPGRNRCFNYGVGNFAAPVSQLSWEVLRGRARLWVEVETYAATVARYQAEDRSIWIQRLPLDQAQVDRLAQRLDADLPDARRFFRYHYSDANCATKVRDQLDAVTGGALRRGGDRGLGITYRELGRRGLADRGGLVAAGLLLLGRHLDREVTVWGSMCHPDHLRAVVQSRLGAAPVQVHARRGPRLPAGDSHGHGWLLLLALLVALPAAASLVLRRGSRAALGVSAALLFLLGLQLWAVALAATAEEVRVNEVLLVFLPTDLLLVVLGERGRRWYAAGRVAELATVSLLTVLGVLRQPLLIPVLVPLLPCLLVLAGGRRLR